MDDTMRNMLAQAFDPSRDSTTRLSILDRIAKKHPEILGSLKDGTFGQPSTPEPQLYQPVTQPKQEAPVRVVTPKNYKGLMALARELTEMKIKALKNGIDDYGNRFMRATEVEAHLQTMGKRPEDFGITQEMLDEWSADPNKPKASMAQRFYQQVKNLGTVHPRRPGKVDRVA